MRDWLTRPAGVRRKAEELYGMVVAAARNPGFYGVGRVADTPEGRFEQVALHLFLIAERVAPVKPEGEVLARHLIEAFVTDMDDCMREMGVGDLTVPKRVKRAAAVFYDRAGAYRDALGVPAAQRQAADPLTALVARTLLKSEAPDHVSAAQAAYIRSSHDALARTSYDDVAAGRFIFAAYPATA
jgi:cytochrome b pre-mRNA-processing protein 3